MKKTRMQKGITLIALIITIIILLILAVVTIGSIKNSNIITYAQNASTDYEKAKNDEEDILSGYESTIKENLQGEEKVTYIGDVPIPAGFYYVTGEMETGLVISDSKSDENNADGKDGNQFVWVQVKEDISTTSYVVGNYRREPDVITGNDGKSYDAVATNLQRAECEDIDKDGTLEAEDFKAELTNSYKAMAESVNKYDGFYVGRYETSMNGTNPQSKYGVTSATAAEDSANTWYGLYALNKGYNTSSVKSTMIWGIQYDKMMTWMGNDATNFDTTKRNTDSQRRTGYVSTDVIRNVYDLGGNSFEGTLEAESTSSRGLRGGLFDANGLSPSNRFGGIFFPSTASSEVGSRLALYIV